MKKEEFYLLTTKHLENNLWFKDEEDFKVGMNFVAIQACRSDVKVLAFILMSNHLHFVVTGTKDSARLFIDRIKLRYSKYLRNKYGCMEFLRGNGVDIRSVQPEDDGLERAIAYVQMNCVAANICSHPSQYPWGTGNAFFRVAPASGRLLETFSGREKCRLLHSWEDALPAFLQICDGGYILPESYVQVSFVESLFRSANRFNYFLSTSSKAKKRLDAADSNLPAFRDQIIHASLSDLCQSLFRKPQFQDLGESEKTEVLRQIRYRFSAEINQIARVTGLSYEETASLLDREQ